MDVFTNATHGNQKFILLMFLFNVITIKSLQVVKIPDKKLFNGDSIPALGAASLKHVAQLRNKTFDKIILGYRLIDTEAKNEYVEIEVGCAIKEAIQQKIVQRKQLFIIGKLWNNFHRIEMIESAIKKTLSNLNLDYLDSYVIHWPMAFKMNALIKNMDMEFEDDVTIESTWAGMEKLVHSNYTRHIGLANFNLEQIQRIVKVAKIKPSILITEITPYLLPKDIIKYCKEQKIVVISHKPCYGAKRVSAIRRQLDMYTEPVILRLAQKYQTTAHQIILRYLVEQDVIPLVQNYFKETMLFDQQVFTFKMEKEDVLDIEKLNIGYRTLRFLKYYKFKEYPFAKLVNKRPFWNTAYGM